MADQNPTTDRADAAAETTPPVDPGATELAGAGAGDPMAKLDKRKTIIGAIVTVVVLVIVFFGIIPKFANYADAWAAIKAMAPIWLVALGIAVVVNLAVYVWPYQAAIPKLRYWPAFVIRQTSFMISNAIPAGGAVGLAVQYAMLGSYEITATAATAGIAVTSVWSLFMTMALPVLGVLAAAMTGEVKPAWIQAAVLGLVALIATIVLFWLILRSEQSARKVSGWLAKLAGPVTRRMKKAPDITAMILHFRDQVVDVVMARWKWITGSNLIVVFAQFGVLYVAILAVSGGQDPVSPAAAFAAFGISRLASMIPITPGGLGTVDAALIAILAGFGMDQNDAVAADLVWRACSFIPQVVIGIGTFIYWRVRQARAGKL